MLAIASAIGASCGAGAERGAADSSAATVPAAPQAQTPGAPLPDSVLRQIAALDDSVLRDTLGPEAPRRLWRLAALYAGLTPLYSGSPGEAFAEQHRPAFDYWEDGWEYNGLHYRLLAWRFPDHALADKAAWELSNLRQVYECEGEVACVISAQLSPARVFLERFPASPLATDAVRRANEAFDSTLAIGAHLEPGDLWVVDSAAIRVLIAGYDSTARELPLLLRARAISTVDRLRHAWGTPRPDSTTPAVEGPVVAFASDTCGVRFRHPASWRVDARRVAESAGWCTLQIQPNATTSRRNQDAEMEPTVIVMRILPINVDQAISPWEFRRIDGHWYAPHDVGDSEESAGVYLGAAWHGVRADRYRRCSTDLSVSTACRTPLVIVGTSRRAARIVAGSRAIGVLELLLRTLSFH